MRFRVAVWGICLSPLRCHLWTAIDAVVTTHKMSGTAVSSRSQPQPYDQAIDLLLSDERLSDSGLGGRCFLRQSETLFTSSVPLQRFLSSPSVMCTANFPQVSAQQNQRSSQDRLIECVHTLVSQGSRRGGPVHLARVIS